MMWVGNVTFEILLTNYSCLQELEQLAKNPTIGFPDLETCCMASLKSAWKSSHPPLSDTVEFSFNALT